MIFSRREKREDAKKNRSICPSFSLAAPNGNTFLIDS
jgi:hypothetical protein